MSYQDYLDGLRDGFDIGFKVGSKIGQSSGFLSGYRDGYDDASLGLPYRPQERLNEYSLNIPKVDPLPIYEYKYETALPKCEPLEIKFEPLPKIELDPILPRYEPPKPISSWSRYEDEKPNRYKGLSYKKPWEKW